MKNRKVLIIDTYEPGRELVSQRLEDLGVNREDIYHAENMQNVEQIIIDNLNTKPLILSESEIRNEHGIKVCTAGLLKKLQEQGHIVVLHSTNNLNELNKEMNFLVRSGLHYVQKSYSHLGCSDKFYNVILEPVLSEKD